MLNILLQSVPRLLQKYFNMCWATNFGNESRARAPRTRSRHSEPAGQPGEHARASPGAAAPGGGDAANDDDIQIACLLARNYERETL